MSTNLPESAVTINPFLEFYDLTSIEVIDNCARLSDPQRLNDSKRLQYCEMLALENPDLPRSLYDKRGVVNLQRYNVADLINSMNIEIPNVVHFSPYYDNPPNPIADFQPSFALVGTDFPMINYVSRRFHVPRVKSWFFECGSPDQLMDQMNIASCEIPQIYIVHAHGNPDRGLCFGKPSGDGVLDMKFIEQYKGNKVMLNPQSVVVFDSCWAGRDGGVAKNFSRLVNVPVIAANRSTGGVSIRLPNDKGSILPDVQYMPPGGRLGYSDNSGSLFRGPDVRTYAGGYEL